MEIALTLGVVVVALIFFIAEWVPIDITAIGVMVALMLLGLVTPDEGISGFGNSATITVLAMFALSAGITRTGAIQVLTNLFVKWGGKHPSRQILVMGSVVGSISAFINNTAVVVVFIPIIEDWCRKRGISSSKLLLPLSYVTVLGGMITVIGTSTNVLASGLSEKLGYGTFSLFQFTGLGIVTATVGLLYLAFAAPVLLPNRKAPDSIGQEYDLKDYVSEIIIKPGSSLIGQTLRSSQIQRKFDLDVLELIRNDSHFPQPLADKVLQAGDILIVRSRRECLLSVKAERGIDILPDVQFGQEELEKNLSAGEEKIGEVLIVANSTLIGSTLKELRFRQRYNVTVLALRRGQELVRERLGKVPLRVGDLLLVQGPKESFLGLQTSSEVLVIKQEDLETLRRDKAWIAVAIGGGGNSGFCVRLAADSGQRPGWRRADAGNRLFETG